jgi:hypothetical protein
MDVDFLKRNNMARQDGIIPVKGTLEIFHYGGVLTCSFIMTSGHLKPEGFSYLYLWKLIPSHCLINILNK